MPGGWLGLDWGNVPAWIGTVVTSTSASIAALSYRRSVLDKEREQATKVAAWVTEVQGADGNAVREMRLRNGSEASVYDLTVLFSDGTATATPLSELLAGETVVPPLTGPVPPTRTRTQRLELVTGLRLPYFTLLGIRQTLIRRTPEPDAPALRACAVNIRRNRTG